MVVLAFALPVAAGLALLIYHFYDQERAEIERDSLLTARSLVHAVDRDLRAGILVASVLASSPSMQAGDLPAAYAQARLTLSDDFPGFNFVLSDADGVQLFNTLRAYGPLQPDPDNVARIRRVFDTGKPAVSDLFIGGVLRRPIVAVHVPVWRDGKVVYCLSVGMEPQRMGRVLSEARLPPDRIVGVLDSQGVFVARSHEPRESVGMRTHPAVLASLRQMPEAAVVTDTLEGVPVFAMYSRSEDTGWAVVVGVPRSAVLNEVLSSVSWVTLTQCLLLAIGLCMAWLLGGRIGKSVRALSDATAALGSGAPLAPALAHELEHAAFREAGEAAAMLLKVEAELERHRHKLESLIAERTAQLEVVNEQMQQARDAAQASNLRLRESEQEALERELRIRTVMDNVREGIITLDERGIVASFNGAASAIFGYAPEEVIGANVQCLMPPELRPAHHAGMVRYLAGGEPAVIGKERVVLPGLRKDGSTFLLELAISAIEVQGRTLFVGILRDVTEQRRAEQALMAAMEQAQQASQAKSAFVANMSHELRTPMNAVLGMAHLLGNTGMSIEQRRYVDMIRSSGEALLFILNDILDFSKIEAGKVELHDERFDLDDVLHAVASIMGVNAGDKALELAIGVQPDVPRALVGDAMRLQQVLVNLTGNALKFTPHGDVALLVDCVTMGADAATLRLRVRDTGIGISADQQQRLFSPFTQADSSMTRLYGGTGLGLTISKSLVELMGGTLEMRSASGEGSEFTITVPFALADCEAAPTLASAALPAGLRVLVVDDHATSRACVAMTAAGLGWHAETAASGAQALDLLGRAGEAFDVVLADWQLPDMNGLSTLAAIGTLPAAPPVIVMAGAYERGTLLAQHGPAHPVAMLTKPVTARSLADAVSMALAECGDGAPPSVQPIVELAARSGAVEQVEQDERQDASGAPANGPASARLTARLLLVEDNPVNQMVARGILEQQGAHVDVANNGADAVALLRERSAEYDLVLMDVQMPVMDGYSATRAIRHELGLTLPVLAMTAGVLDAERQHCIDAGMDDFIGKPLDIEQMLATIRRHLAR